MSSNDDGFVDSILSHRKRMETISEIIEGEIYLSSLLAATQAAESLGKKGITHIISILKEPFIRHSNVEYLIIGEDDSSDTDLLKHFQETNAFIGTFLSADPSVSLCGKILFSFSGCSRPLLLLLAPLSSVFGSDITDISALCGWLPKMWARVIVSASFHADEAKSKGGAVLLHCQSGVSRSATITIAYLMYSRGMAATKAYEFVKKRRVSINPNLSFVRQLQEYDDILRSEGTIQSASASPSSSPGTLEPTPFLVHYLRSTIPVFTQNIPDDQLLFTAKRCDYNYIQVLASLRQQANPPTAS